MTVTIPAIIAGDYGKLTITDGNITFRKMPRGAHGPLPTAQITTGSIDPILLKKTLADMGITDAKTPIVLINAQADDARVTQRMDALAVHLERLKGVESMRNGVARMSDDVLRSKTDIEDLKTSLDMLKGAVETIPMETSRMGNAIDKLSADMSEMRLRVTGLASSLNTVADSDTAVRRDTRDLQESTERGLTGMAAALSTLAGELAAARREHAELVRRLAAYPGVSNG